MEVFLTQVMVFKNKISSIFLFLWTISIFCESCKNMDKGDELFEKSKNNEFYV